MVEGSEFVVACDAVITAIGQRIDRSWAAQLPELQWSRRTTLSVDAATMQTAIPYVFAGGDMVSGPASVIEAVAAGHKAVTAICSFLNHEDLDFRHKNRYFRIHYLLNSFFGL